MERWLPVAGFEDRYMVSDLGRIKLLRCTLRTWYGTRVRGERLMKARVGSNGYLKVCLQRDGNLKYASVHVLVLTAFIGPPSIDQEARHLNGDRSDSRLSNLAWGTKKENMRDQYIHGTRVCGDRHPASKITQEMVNYIRSSPLNGYELARQMSLGTSTVWRIRTGKCGATLLG